MIKLALEQSQVKVNNIQANEDFNQVLAEVAGYLTSDERAATSFMNYLNMANGAHYEAPLLKERLYTANLASMRNVCQAPQFPLPIQRVRV